MRTMASVMTTSTPTAVYVNQITLDLTVRQRLMTVIGLSARTMEPVKMKSTLSPVSVQMGSLGTHVKLMLMTAR